jgi:hypothetical protein
MNQFVAINPVPPVTQQGNGIANDCGAAKLEGIAEAFGLPKKTVETVYREADTSGGTDGLTLTECQAWLTKQGISNYRATITAPRDLYQILYERRVVLALILYGPLVDAGLTEYANFRGNHYVNLISQDIANGYINDPYRSTAEAGHNLQIPLGVFFQAWAACNPAYQGIVTEPIRKINPAIVTTDLYKITATNGVNVRTAPTEYGNVPVSYIGRGEIVHARKATNGYAMILDGLYNADGTFKTPISGGVSLAGKYFYSLAPYATPYQVPV